VFAAKRDLSASSRDGCSGDNCTQQGHGERNDARTAGDLAPGFIVAGSVRAAAGLTLGLLSTRSEHTMSVARDATASDARRDAVSDGGVHDATMSDGRADVGRDGPVDATTDGHAVASSDAPARSDATAFNGSCKCTGDACVPITVISGIAGDIDGIGAALTGVCVTTAGTT
jgi:hypothetical protein